MSPAKQLQGRGELRSAASILKESGFEGIRNRQAQYAHIRAILAEKIGKLVPSEGYDINLGDAGSLEIIADSAAQADLLRQSMPLVREALEPAGIGRVRLRSKPA